MYVTARSFWAPKAGNRSDEYEDAFWPPRRVNRSGGHFRFAVADGATETSFAALWAQRLVHAYGAGCFAGADWLEELRRQQAGWYAEVLQKPLPWYAEEKVRSGAYAALLGFELATAWTWQSIAVGDCCLFQWRGEERIAAFPAQAVSFFTSRPFLVPSNSAGNADLGQQIVRQQGEWRPGDRFALLSDALAQWVWRSLEAELLPWPMLEEIHQAGQQRLFRQWVDALRRRTDLRNDDVTALLITVQ